MMMMMIIIIIIIIIIYDNDNDNACTADYVYIIQPLLKKFIVLQKGYHHARHNKFNTINSVKIYTTYNNNIF